MTTLFQKKFSEFCICQNALVPLGEKKPSWEKRLSEGMVGVIISENIIFSETVLPDGMDPEIKMGLEVRKFESSGYKADRTLLHNTHSWIIMAINSKG